MTSIGGLVALLARTMLMKAHLASAKTVSEEPTSFAYAAERPHRIKLNDRGSSSPSMYHGTPMMETAPFCIFLEASVFAEVEGKFALALELNYSFDSPRHGGQFCTIGLIGIGSLRGCL